MWTIVKLESKKINLFKEDLNKKLDSNYKIYKPQLLIQKYVKNKLSNNIVNLLGNYVFCYHKKFEDVNTINYLKNLRGLNCFLGGFVNSQKEITNFIDKCKRLEDRNGFISSNLYEINMNSYYRFSSGPFAEKIFKIINLQRNNINILMGNIKTTINRKEFLFSPV